jgi:nucleotide-binding universal stress UspA family protein
MGTHGASGFDEFFIGSNTHRVATLAECPVISVQKFAKKVGFSNIVLPIDNGLHSRQKVNNVIELAEVYKSTVHILGLLGANENAEDERKLELKIETIKDKLEQKEISFTTKLIKGHHLATEAMDYSGEVNGDLIVVLTGHESNLTGAFFDAFAEQIVNHSKIPIMSVKPEETAIETFDPAGGTGVII